MIKSGGCTCGMHFSIAKSIIGTELDRISSIIMIAPWALTIIAGVTSHWLYRDYSEKDTL